MAEHAFGSLTKQGPPSSTFPMSSSSLNSICVMLQPQSPIARWLHQDGIYWRQRCAPWVLQSVDWYRSSIDLQPVLVAKTMPHKYLPGLPWRPSCETGGVMPIRQTQTLLCGQLQHPHGWLDDVAIGLGFEQTQRLMKSTRRCFQSLFAFAIFGARSQLHQIDTCSRHEAGLRISIRDRSS